MSNLIIGDNLDVLKDGKHLDKSYKMIYLDPPYNTCTNKSYKDKEDSNIWSNQIKERLIALKPYLADNGVLMISIDDNEYATTKILCDDVFGKKNFLGTFITRQATRSNSKHINTIHEYVICFAKNKSKVKPFSIKRIEMEENVWMIVLQDQCTSIFESKGKEEAQNFLNNYLKKNADVTWLRNYNRIDDDGRIFFASDLSTPGTPREVSIPEIDLYLKPLKSRGWTSDARFIELHKLNLLDYKNGRPYEKKYLLESTDNAPSILNFYSRQGTNDLSKLGLEGLFDTPKPLNLMKYLIRMVCQEGDKVLDIYGGSGTTAHACEDLGLQWTLIQRDEEVQDDGVLKACEKLGINPNIVDILKTRLNKISKQYTVEEI